MPGKFALCLTLLQDKDKDKDKSKDDSTGDPLTKYGYDLSRKERADRRNAELAKMKADYSAQKAADKVHPFGELPYQASPHRWRHRNLLSTSKHKTGKYIMCR